MPAPHADACGVGPNGGDAVRRLEARHGLGEAQHRAARAQRFARAQQVVLVQVRRVLDGGASAWFMRIPVFIRRVTAR